MTDQTPVPTALERPVSTGPQPIATNPITGELVDLSEINGVDLAAVFDAIIEHTDRVAEFRQAVVAEVARRADRRNARKVDLDGIVWEVNAPTEDSYNLDELLGALSPFVRAGVLDESAVAALKRYPPPPPPPAPRLDKRELNKLLKHPDRDVLAAIARVRKRTSPKRTAKVIARTVDATAEELPDA